MGRGRHERSGLAAPLLAVAAVLALGAEVRAEARPEALRERAESILSDGYQRELPTDASPEATQPRGCGSPSPDVPSSPPGPAGVLVEILLYGLLAALVLWLLVAVGREVSRRRRSAAAEEEGGAATGSRRPHAPAPAMDEAEALAAGGRFDAAAHLLLQRVLAWLVRREGRPLPDSLTSREVLAITSLRGERRDALEALVAAVEHSLFGGRPVGREEWERCLAAYRHLADRVEVA